MRNILIFSTALLLSACQYSPNEPQSTQYLTVLHTNDNHGRFWRNDKGEYGMAARKTLIDKLKSEAENSGHAVILLSGGDINTGVPESDLQFAEPDFKGMKKLGYDAMALGNHEFDNSRDVLAKQIEWAGFPILSANIIDNTSQSPAYTPYTIIKKEGLTIAVLGLTTVDTVKIANPKHIDGLTFIEPLAATQDWAPKIKAKYNPDVMIAVTHMGHYHDAAHGINAPGDVTLARQLAPGTLDLIVGGHSQEPVCVDKSGKENTHFSPGKTCKPDNQNGTWIMQAHEWGKYVGKAVFKISGDTKTLVSYNLIPVNLKDDKGVVIGESIEEDLQLLAFLKPFQDKGQAQIAGAVGSVDSFLDGRRSTVRFKQSKLADLIINAQMAAVEADFGIISGGGIRDSIEQGDISYKDVLKVHPFRNRITYVDWQGKDLINYLNTVAQFPPDSGAYMQYHHITFDLKDNKVVNVKIAGQPLALNQRYRMSINSYNAAGGDGYPKVNQLAEYTATDFTDAQVLKDYLQKHSPIKAVDL
ncbi:bifunctional UDP-sugar hydrolase/5'-nucleotidase [Pseudoalteromonas sp. SCSIO 43201]|uniref:bifunctional UDP-sugar hydrolase/5'-nucleotidase UshA n=1 Tax=Pseudoalteromonas sp. SCSIO 43201 TaxID=2822842 RepID=UPI002076101E|nr:bifunctional UDP-sugar hydrolase/5'-nucleotidase UshA [Pseudoalteromonas sp. SCSIO 43201]USD30741.1 bifunctional UDP-sugar hydrolase/5'-nucleotidase [Pseudoalteromonas sp. SCSIO 43201]